MYCFGGEVRVSALKLIYSMVPIFGLHFVMPVLVDGYRCNGTSFDDVNASTIVGSAYLLPFF